MPVASCCVKTSRIVCGELFALTHLLTVELSTLQTILPIPVSYINCICSNPFKNRKRLSLNCRVAVGLP
jgi:hypothetical protein